MASSSNSSGSFSEQSFEKKLLALKDSQESIQGLSGWCIQHRTHYKHFVQCWLKVLKRAKLELRLTLFYLANDVIQHSKKKSYLNIVTAWEPAIKEAVPHVREVKLRKQISRIFNIWEEREVYSKETIQGFTSILENATSPKAKESKAVVSDFDPAILLEKLQSSKSLEDDTDLKQRRLNESSIKITDVETFRTSLKDRKKTAEFFADFEDSILRMEEYVKALQAEAEERAKLITVLEQSDIFYETQRGEFKVLCNAYKNFASRVKAVKRKLDEVTPTLPDHPVQHSRKESSSPLASGNGTSMEISDTFEALKASLGQPNSQPNVPQDLDSRLNIFLSGGGANSLFGMASAPLQTPPVNPVPPMEASYGFYPGAPFGNQLSALFAQPPPPPPPPPPLVPAPLLPPPVFSELSLPQPPPPPPPAPPASLSGSDSGPWIRGPIPSWSSEASFSAEDESANVFSDRDIDLRNKGRPVVHSNLISLTQGPSTGSGTPTGDSDWRTHTRNSSASSPIAKELELPPWLRDVLQAQGGQPSNEGGKDLVSADEERVNRLLDSVKSKLNETEEPTKSDANHQNVATPDPLPSNDRGSAAPQHGHRPVYRGESPANRAAHRGSFPQGKYRPRTGGFHATPPRGYPRPYGPRW